MQFWNSWGVKSSAAKKRNSQCQSLVKRKGLVCLKVIQIKNNGRFLPLSPASFKKHPQTNSPAFLCQTRSVSEYTTHRCRHLEKQKSGVQHCWSQFSFKNLSWVWVARQVSAALRALLLSSPGRLPGRPPDFLLPPDLSAEPTTDLPADLWLTHGTSDPLLQF